MPADAIYVGRPSRWGNPFPVSEKIPVALAIELFGDLCRGFFSPAKLAHLTDDEFLVISQAKERWLKRNGYDIGWAARTFLRGHDLACWCRIDQPCHADVLLEVANR